MTSTGSDGHVLVLFEDDIGIVIIEEYHDGGQFVGSTAGFGHGFWVH